MSTDDLSCFGQKEKNRANRLEGFKSMSFLYFIIIPFFNQFIKINLKQREEGDKKFFTDNGKILLLPIFIIL